MAGKSARTMMTHGPTCRESARDASVDDARCSAARSRAMIASVATSSAHDAPTASGHARGARARPTRSAAAPSDNTSALSRLTSSTWGCRPSRAMVDTMMQVDVSQNTRRAGTTTRAVAGMHTVPSAPAASSPLTAAICRKTSTDAPTASMFRSRREPAVAANIATTAPRLPPATKVCDRRAALSAASPRAQPSPSATRDVAARPSANAAVAAQRSGSMRRRHPPVVVVVVVVGDGAIPPPVCSPRSPQRGAQLTWAVPAFR